LLIELLKTLIRQAAGGLIRLAHWPAPHRSAAVLTHDLEPSRFAYTRGAKRLLVRVARSGHPATFGVIARPAARYLADGAAEQLAHYDVACHGLEHRSKAIALPREDMASRLRSARRCLEERLGRPTEGFRSPRLDRSPNLLWALDRVGFRYDSSYPDVDRENVTTFGGGVRLNLPFRPPVGEGVDRVRPSACLELPVSAPDCIQPLFGGSTLRELAHAVCQKLAFIRATGGLYVGIVHAGVFGPRDAARRGAHLGFIRRRLRHPDLWLASASEIAEWWCAREQLTISVLQGGLQLTNRSDRVVDGVQVVVERTDGDHVYSVPSLAPGASTILEVGVADAAGSPRPQAPRGVEGNLRCPR